eukprot:SAG11_NODE_1361_length_5112_cov_2.921404_2_plen_347_part_00
MSSYGSQSALAVEGIAHKFPGLNLNNKLAIIVPDAEFESSIKAALEVALKQQLPNRSFQLVTALEASSSIHQNSMDATENIVLSTIDDFDGLERLIVVAVGLDSSLNGDDTYVLQARSKLYRAVTRAHMMVVVVNELLHGGFLEFLGHVKLVDQKLDFHNHKEVRRTNEIAASIVKSRVEAVEAVELSEELRSLQHEQEGEQGQPSTVYQNVWDSSANSAAPPSNKLAFAPFETKFEITESNVRPGTILRIFPSTPLLMAAYREPGVRYVYHPLMAHRFGKELEVVDRGIWGYEKNIFGLKNPCEEGSPEREEYIRERGRDQVVWWYPFSVIKDIVYVPDTDWQPG